MPGRRDVDVLGLGISFLVPFLAAPPPRLLVSSLSPFDVTGRFRFCFPAKFAWHFLVSSPAIFVLSSALAIYKSAGSRMLYSFPALQLQRSAVV